MRVKVLQAMRGPALKLDPGDIYDGDDTELARWCSRGIAEPVEVERETPEAPKPELKPKAKRKRNTAL